MNTYELKDERNYDFANYSSDFVKEALKIGYGIVAEIYATELKLLSISIAKSVCVGRVRGRPSKSRENIFAILICSSIMAVRMHQEQLESYQEPINNNSNVSVLVDRIITFFSDIIVDEDVNSGNILNVQEIGLDLVSSSDECIELVIQKISRLDFENYGKYKSCEILSSMHLAAAVLSAKNMNHKNGRD